MNTKEFHMMNLPPRFTHYAHTSTNQKTILIVEPDPAIRKLLVYSFTLSQYSCSVIDDIASLTWIEQMAQTTPPDAIVLDIDIRTPAFKKPLDFLHAFCTVWQHTGLPK